MSFLLFRPDLREIQPLRLCVIDPKVGDPIGRGPRKWRTFPALDGKDPSSQFTSAIEPYLAECPTPSVAGSCCQSAP
jgi:hypothetical protein